MSDTLIKSNLLFWIDFEIHYDIKQTYSPIGSILLQFAIQSHEP